MTIQYKRRNKVNTIKITFDTFRMAGIFCLICCAFALGCGIQFWIYDGFSWIVLLAIICAAMANILTVILLTIKSKLEFWNEFYGIEEEGDDE